MSASHEESYGTFPAFFPASFAADLEPVRITLDPKKLEQCSSEKRKLMESLASLVEQEISYSPGLSYNEPLPSSRLICGGTGTGQDVPSLIQLLPDAPDADEVRSLSMTFDAETGVTKPVRLNRKQLDQISKRGTFDVPSKLHLGHKHVWKVARWLQKGQVPIQESFREGLACCLHHVIIGVPDRLFNKTFFSLHRGIIKLISGLVGIVNILIGWSETLPKYSEYEIDQLKVQRENDYIRTCMQENADFCDSDLRIFDNEYLKNIQRLVDLISNQGSAEWAHRRQIDDATKIRKELKILDGKDSRVCKKRYERELNRRRQEFVAESLKSNEELERKAPGMGKLFAERARLELLLSEINEDFEEKVQSQREIIRCKIIQENPIFGLVDDWVVRRLDKLTNEFRQETRVNRFKDIVLQSEEGLDFMAVAYGQYVTDFRLNKEDKLRKELAMERKPSRMFHFHRTIWRPKNWKKQEIRNVKGFIRFEPQKFMVDEINTTDCLWRFRIVFLESRRNLCNGLHSLFRSLWSGPVGVKSLFLKHPFISRYIMDEQSGEVIQDRRHRTHTLHSRLRSIFDRVRSIRQDFEQQPDTGFLGKPIARILNMMSAYGGIAIPGTIILVLGQPALTVVHVCIAAFLIITSPVWALASGIFGYIFSACIFDFHAAHGNHTPMTGDWFPLIGHIIGDIILSGAVLSGVAVIMGLVIHPLLATLILSWTTLSREFSTLYDCFMRTAIVRFGRVPGHDSFLAWRIAGPGITAKYCYQISPEVAIMTLSAKLEEERLHCFVQRADEAINLPVKRYIRFFEEFSAFGLVVDITSCGSISKLVKARDAQSKDLNKKVHAHITEYKKLYSVPRAMEYEDGKLKCIKQSSEELGKTLRMGVKLVSSFVNALESEYYKDITKKIWFSANAAEGDHEALTRKFLSDIFSAEFLHPLQDTDDSITIPVQHERLERLLERLMQPVDENFKRPTMVDGSDLV